MRRLPRVSGQRVVRALEKDGFAVSHVRGSHYYLRKPGAPNLVVVPVHAGRILPLGTLRSVLKQAELSAEELVNLLKAR